MSNPVVHSSNTGISGPGFVSLQVRDVAAAADFYDASPLSFWDYFGRRTIELASLPSGSRVLDVCCGAELLLCQLRTQWDRCETL